jgi:peptide/nickel transport system ATP-binding protein
MTSLLEVEDLRTHIRTRDATVKAVDGVTLSIGPGETVGLVGESGCGKSMTGMSIMGLLPPGGSIVSGSVKLEGRELTALSDGQMRTVRGNEVAMVFQDPMTSLNPTMTIGDQIAEPLRIHRNASRAEAMERAAEVLQLVGMPKPRERLSAYPHQLSGGLRQRVVIAMALACEPKLLIADEPTTALDVTIQGQILALLDDLKERLNMGLLLITHDMGVIAGRADRVLVMYAGRLAESGETHELFHAMRHPYTQALLESIPTLETDRGKSLYSIPGLPPDLTNAPNSCRFSPRCRYSQDRCRAEEPSLAGDQRGHLVACFFPVEGPRRAAGAAAEAGAAAGAAEKEASPSVQVITDREARDESHSQRGDPLLVIDHVVKEFPIAHGVLQRRAGSVKAVSDVSFDVGRGETFGLVGESGCGKTTLGRLIVALENLDSGGITVDGQEVSKMRGRDLRRKRQDLQMIFQDPYASLDPRMRIGATLREPLTTQHIGTKREQRARIHDLLGDVGLSPRALDLYPHEFSGGQRQRIGFARALALEPRLIVADEPVSALDVSVQSQVLNLMRRLQSERDLTYVIISHDLSVVRYLANRIGVMYLGKLVEIGSGDEIYRHPAHPYTAGLLASIPEPEPAIARNRVAVAVSGELPSAANPPSGCRFRTRCPAAQALCAEQEPALRPFNTASHQAACHFPLQTPLAVEQSASAG